MERQALSSSLFLMAKVLFSSPQTFSTPSLGRSVGSHEV